MRINEQFVSIQGEGQTIGTPAYFIRTAGCNLRCPDCDTKYSFDENGKEYSLQQLTDSFHATNLDTIVMTGGEPLLQWDDIWKFSLKARPKRMIIETNGTICPPTTEIYSNAYFVVSPKLFTNLPMALTRYKDTLCAIFQTIRQAELKILYFGRSELYAARELLEKFISSGIILQRPITFQPGIPSGMKDSEIPEWLVHLLTLYMDHRYEFPPSRFIVQSHKWLWGQKKRGV